MGELVWLGLGAGLVLLMGIGLLWRPFRAARIEARFAVACRDFHRQRERLEAKFVQLGQLGIKADSSQWSDCSFDDDVAYARNRSTGQLCAFVAVTIDMDDSGGRFSVSPDILGGPRMATAVFSFDGHRWETEGRAIFNLTPTEAIHFYQRHLKMIGQEVFQRS